MDNEHGEHTKPNQSANEWESVSKPEEATDSEKSEQYKERVSKIVELLDEEATYSKRVEEADLSSRYGLGPDDVEDYYTFSDQTPLDERMLEDIRDELAHYDYASQEYKEAEEIMQDTSAVRNAIENTIGHLGDYFTNTCRQRLENGAGSIYDGISTVDSMEYALMGAHWKKANHPDVMPGCQAYVTEDIEGGHFGLLKIADLPDDAVIIASDPKGTGKVSMTVSGQKGPAVKETWLIVGEEDGRDVVYTFHQGEPVRPSLVEVKDCPDGTKLTKDQAIAMGFDLAKIIA